MRPPTPTLSSKKRYPSLVVIIGLFFGILVTALTWLKLPNQFITALSLFSLSLIGLGSFFYFQKPLASRPRWIIVLAALGAVSLVYLFPELFGPTCGGMPRAFASPSVRCGHCVDFVCEWSDKTHQEHCYCDEWDDTGCTGNLPPTIAADLTCGLWGQNGWCAGSYSLDLSATEPQGLDVMISGDINGAVFACPASPASSTCSVPFPEGSGTAAFTATSVSGLTASGSSSYQHDSVQPQINGWLNGSSGTNGWFISVVDVNASASDPLPGSGLAAFVYNLDGAGWGNFPGLLSLPDGVHSLSLRASDFAGNIVNTVQTVQVDTVTPALDLSVTGTAGVNGWYRSNVQIGAATFDSGSGLGALEYNLNGAGWTNYTVPLELGDGSHSVNMRAIDIAGNSTTWSQNFRIDTLTPILDITVDGTLGTSGWYTSLVQVNLSASDPDSPPSAASGLGALEYNLDGAGWTNYSTSLELGDGLHNLQFRATDLAGNVTSGTQGFKVDSVQPAVDVNVSGAQGVSPWYVTFVQVEAAAGDATSNLSSLEVKMDDGDWSAYNAPLVFGDGLHTYRFRAQDNAGNQTVTPLNTLQVDTIPPAISLPNFWNAGETANFELLDSVSGLASVRMVIEDQDGRYPKITWDDVLASYKFDGKINWDGRFPDGSTPPPGGGYYASLKVTDNAGNENQMRAQIHVPLESYIESRNVPPGSLVFGTMGAGVIPTLIPNLNSDEVPLAMLQAKSVPLTLSFGGSNADEVPGEQSALKLGSEHNGAAQPTGAQTGMTSFDAGGQSNSPASNSSSNLLWGATAMAAIGAFAAEITRRKQEEEAAELARQAKRMARAEKENMGGHELLTGKQIAKAYQASLDTLKSWLNAARSSGMTEAEAAKLKNDVATSGKIGASLGATKDYIARKEAEAQAQEQAERMTRKEALLEPNIPPKQLSSFPPDMGWKERDYAQTEHSQDVASVVNSQLAMYTPVNIQKPKTWWDRPLDWIDKHQKEVSIGIGIGVGLVTMAVVLVAAAGAVVTLPVLLVAAGVAAVVAGAEVAVGTALLNNHFGRELTTNLWSNIRAAALPAAATTGLGLFLLGGGLTSGLITVGNAGGALCMRYQAACNYVEPVMKGIDFVEEAGLMLKGWVQTARGDMAGATETAMELQMEYMDGGVPGNAVAKQLGEELSEWATKYGDDVFDYAWRYGDDAIELIGKYGNDGINLLRQYGDDAISLYNKHGNVVIPLLLDYGNDAIKLLDVSDINSARILLTNLDKDVLDYAIDQGPDAVNALSRWDERLLGEYGIELAMRSGQDAKALRATKELITLKPIDPKNLTPRQKELINIIAENSVQQINNGHVVVGKWTDYDSGFSGYALENSAIHYSPHPDLWPMLGDLGDMQGEVAWLVNQRAIRLKMDQGLPFEYTLQGIAPEKVNFEISAIEGIWNNATDDEILELLNIAQDNIPYRMKELRELHNAGYILTFDEVYNSYILIKP